MEALPVRRRKKEKKKKKVSIRQIAFSFVHDTEFRRPCHGGSNKHPFEKGWILHRRPVKNTFFKQRFTFKLNKDKKGTGATAIFCLLCTSCAITIKRCKLLIYGGKAKMWLCEVDFGENSWALLPCGEEIKTLQTPVCF